MKIPLAAKRHAEIDEGARELLAREPEKAAGNVDDIRANIACHERSRKIKNVGMEQLRALWAGQMSDGARNEVTALIAGAKPEHSEQRMGIAKAAVTWAQDHLFDRKSVVHEHEVWSHALEHARGENLELAEVHATTAGAGYILDADNPRQVTTRDVCGQVFIIFRDGMR